MLIFIQLNLFKFKNSRANIFTNVDEARALCRNNALISYTVFTNLNTLLKHIAC